MSEDQLKTDSVELATELTIAWLSNPNTRAQANEVPEFLRTMHQAVSSLNSAPEVSEQEQAPSAAVPAVSVRKSLASKEHIISLLDGKPYKTLRRHLSQNGLTPEEYRQKFGLKPDYPMVAPAYADRRREMAKAIGLGRKPKSADTSKPKAEGRAPSRRRRAKSTDA